MSTLSNNNEVSVTLLLPSAITINTHGAYYRNPNEKAEKRQTLQGFISDGLTRLFLALKSYGIPAGSSPHHALDQIDIDRSCTEQSNADH